MCWISALTTPLGLATPAFHISAALNAQHNLQLYANLGNIGHSAVASLSSTTLSINATFLIPGFANLFRKFCQGTLQFADKLKFSISILYFSNVLIQAKTIDDVLIKIRQNKFENISAPLVTEEMELAAKDLAKFMNLLSKKKARAVKQMIPNGSSQTDAQMIEIVEDYQSIEYTDGNSRTQMTVDIEIAQECIPSNENKSSKKKILEETQAITSLLPTTIKLCQRIEKEQISKNKSENIKKGSSSIDIIRTVKLKNGKIQMPSDIIMALKIDIRENIGMKDPVKAGHHYRKYQEDYPKRLPKVIHIYLEETSGVLLKDAKMICIHTKSDGTKVSAYELSDEQFGILVETSNGLKVASSFVHPDSLKNITNNLKNIPITDDFTPAEIPEYVKAMTESLGLYKVDVEIKTDGSTTKNIFEFLDQSPNEQYYAEIARILKAMTLDKKYYSSKS